MRIYVSSTSDDLRQFRADVAEQLSRLGHEIVSMEGYSADARGPVEKCLDDVASADAYVGLIAFHYGTVPPGHSHSITEMEFRKASECGLPRFVFLVPEDVAWPVKYIDRGESGLQITQFRQDLQTGGGYTLTFFRDKEELLKKAPQAIATLSPRPAPMYGSRPTFGTVFRETVRPLNFDAEKNKHLGHFTGRGWVEERLDDWIIKRPKSRVFCLFGGPGIGKSAIACHWCNTRKDVVAAHYCVHGHAERTDPQRILLSLVAQMSSHFPEYEKQLAARGANELGEIAKGDARTIFDNLFLRPLAGDFAAPARHQLVIIDALDEASRGPDNELASLLGEVWVGLPDWVRLVVTSREEMDVGSYLENLNPFYLNADSPKNLQDIRAFLCRELEPLGTTPREQAVNEIVEKSEGMFLYAYLVLEEIRSGGLSLNRTAEFPEGLTGYYKRWFDRKFPDRDSYRREFHELVSVIVAQRAPLPESVLAGASGLKSWELDRRLDKLGALFPLRLEHQGNQKVKLVTLMHKSLHDWLTGEHHLTGRPRAGPFAADPELGNQLLAEQGWNVYSAGKLSQDSYFEQALLAHLSDARQTERLAKILLDPLLLDTLWTHQLRYEWQRHINCLSHTLSLAGLVRDWLNVHSSPPAGTPHDAAVMGKLGRLFQELGAFDEAVLLVEAALKIWHSNRIIDSPEMVSSLLAMGTIQSARDELDRATASYEKALAIAQRAYAQDSTQMADVLYQTCVFYTKGKRDYKKAWDCLEKSLAIYSQSNPPNYAGMANCVNDKAVILEAEGRAGDYLGFYQEALAIFEKAYPNGHPEMVANLSNIGYEMRKRGKETDAIEKLQRAVALAEKILLPQHEYSGDARSRLTGALIAERQYDAALEVLRTYVAELERFPGAEHEDTARARLQLCGALLQVVHFSDFHQRGEYREDLRDQSRRLRCADPATVLGLLDLGNDARRIAEPILHDCLEEAALRSARAHAEKPRANPAESVSAKCLADAVDTLVSGGPWSEITPQILKLWEDAQPKMEHQADCLAKTRKLLVRFISWTGRMRLDRDGDVQSVHQTFDLISQIGAETPETLDHLASLAVAVKYHRDYGTAELLCERVLELSERLLGSEHTQTLTYVSNHAWVCEYGGRLPCAERYFRRAYESSCRVLGPEHSSTISAASSLIACLVRLKETEQAATLFRDFLASLPQSDSATSARHYLANCLNQRAIELKGEFAEYQAAQVFYELCLEIKPDDAITCCNLALLLWSCIGDFAHAALRFDQALSLQPSSGHIHSTYAMFLTHTQRDYQRALPHFEESMVLAPNENHIPGNFATWLILSGDLQKGWELAKRSMKLCLPKPDRVMLRPLLCAMGVLLLKQQDPSIPLGQMKTLFVKGIDHVAWIVTALLEEFDRRLPCDQSRLLRLLAEAIADKQKLSALETDPLWQATPPVPLEAPWPEDGRFAGSRTSFAEAKPD